MNQMKMGKIWSFMLILLLLLPTFVFGESDLVGPNFDIEYDVEGSILRLDTVQERPLTIKIKQGDKTYFIGQGVTDKSGSISFSIRLEKENKYQVFINLDGYKYDEEIYIGKDEGEPSEVLPPFPPKESYVSIYIKGYNGLILDEKNIVLKGKPTVLSISKDVLKSNKIKYTDNGGYFSSIDGQSEFDKGKDSGWMFSINGKFPNIGADNIKVKDKDRIEWLYTKDLGEDVGGRWKQEDTSNDPISQALKLVKDGKSKEKEVIDGLKNMEEYFKNKSKDLNEKEKNTLLSEGEEALAVLELAMDRANKRLGESIAKTGLSIGEELILRIGSGDIKRLSKIINGNLGLTMVAMDHIESSSERIRLGKNLVNLSLEMGRRLYDKEDSNLKEFRKTFYISFNDKGQEFSFVIPKEILQELKSQEVELVRMDSKKIGLVFNGKDLFDKEDKIKITISASGGSIKLKLEQANQEIYQFNHPVKVWIQLEKDDKNINSKYISLSDEDGSFKKIGGLSDKKEARIRTFTKELGKFQVKDKHIDFHDLGSHRWALDPVENLSSIDIVTGRSGSKYDPGASVTRAEFSALVARMLGLNGPGQEDIKFTDIDRDKWYYEPVQQLQNKGYINGRTQTIFDPSGKITREEMSKILGEILMEYDYKSQDTSILDRFNDGTEISKWARKGSAIVVENKALQGSGGNFSPKNNATRAEAATLLYRVYDLIMK